jgi:hypothetical protein
MFSKFNLFRIFSSASFLVLNVSPFVPASVPIQIINDPTQAQLHNRVAQPVSGNDTTTISSVFVPNVFFYPVVQQPVNNTGYVSPLEDLITEFALPQKYGSIGLLAHNDLAGDSFDELSIGQKIYLIYEDGGVNRYAVSQIYRFRALEPNDTRSQFEDLSTGEVLTARQVFLRMYTGAAHLTFQTCIDANGEKSWGRLFVIAEPVSS